MRASRHVSVSVCVCEEDGDRQTEEEERRGKKECVCVCAPAGRHASAHLAGVQPVLHGVRAPQARDDQVIKGVLARQGQQGSTHPHAKKHKEAGKMLDPHL